MLTYHLATVQLTRDCFNLVCDPELAAARPSMRVLAWQHLMDLRGKRVSTLRLQQMQRAAGIAHGQVAA